MRHIISSTSGPLNIYTFPMSAMPGVAALVKPLTTDPAIAKELNRGLGQNTDGTFHIIVAPTSKIASALELNFEALGGSRESGA